MEKLSSNFEAYLEAVMEGLYPESPAVPRGPIFHNDAGGIFNIAYGLFGGLALIESVPGSVRSNHYHKTDWHFLTVAEGLIHYYWRKVGRTTRPDMMVFRAGDTFFTPPLIEHAVVSMGHSRLVSLSKLSRRHDTHEDDLMRVKLVENRNGKIVVFGETP